MKKPKLIIFYIFILYGCTSSLLYFWGLAAGDPFYSNLRARSQALFLSSPMPLLFDRRDFFNTTLLEFTFTDGSTEVLKLDRKFMATLGGNSHRKLHFLRLFAFDKFYSSPHWVAAVQFIVCKPNNAELHLQNLEKPVKEIRIENIYKTGGGVDQTLTIVTCD